ncbi:MAG: metalloenzyme [Thermoanaerobaculia bacterium]|nr:metalloenzyme [Thermoanaerobaculia bacterium]
MSRLLLIFVDGVGLAPASDHNPLATVATPALHRLLGGALTRERVGWADGVALAALDARLGVPGRPQSVTGQASLLTGVNAAAIAGRHVTGFVGAAVRRLLTAGNLFSRARRRGLPTCFANAYAPLPPGRRRPPSVTTVATAAAGLERLSVDDLAAGRAVTWDVSRRRFARATGLDLSPVEPVEAGRHLGRLALDHRLTVFETFLTDLAGHGRGVSAEEAVAAVDGLLGGVLEARAAAPAGRRLTVLLTSDHGNLEDARSRLHTLNPVPLLAVGPRARDFSRLSSILAVTPRILEASNAPS